jgi:hypothetical protein
MPAPIAALAPPDNPLLPLLLSLCWLLAFAGPTAAEVAAAAAAGHAQDGMAAAAAGSDRSLMLLPVIPGAWKEPTRRMLPSKKVTLVKIRSAEPAGHRHSSSSNSTGEKQAPGQRQSSAICRKCRPDATIQQAGTAEACGGLCVAQRQHQQSWRYCRHCCYSCCYCDCHCSCYSCYCSPWRPIAKFREFLAACAMSCHSAWGSSREESATARGLPDRVLQGKKHTQIIQRQVRIPLMTERAWWVTPQRPAQRCQQLAARH